MLSLKNAFYILFLLLFSFGSFGAIFERLTQSKTHPNIYFQYQATGNVRTSVDVYEITPKGWTVKNVLVFGELTDLYNFQINKVSVSEYFLYVSTHSQVVRFDLDVNGLPLQSSMVSLWQSDDNSSQSLFMSDNAKVFYTYDRVLSELSLYVAKGDTYELADKKSNVSLSENEVSIHPDGSLIKGNSVYPLQGNKIGDYINNSDLTEFNVHQDANLGRNIFFDDNGDIIFKTNTAYNGGYVAKLSWPISKSEPQYTKLIETQKYSSDINLGNIDDFMLSADKKWLIIFESTICSCEFYLFHLDTNYNVISHWHFDESWFSSNVEDYFNWKYNVGLTPPIEVGNSLWVGDLQLDISNPTQLVNVQDIGFLTREHVTEYSSYLLYGDDLVIIPESDNGAILLKLDEQSNIVSREAQLLPLDYSKVTGSSPQDSDDYKHIESVIFEDGNINNFSIHFDSEYSDDYDAFFNANWIFDTIGFLDHETLVIYSKNFPHSVKVKKFPHSIGFLQKPLPEITLNQHDTLFVNLAEYIELPDNAIITLTQYSDVPGEAEYDILSEFTDPNLEFTVSKIFALRQNNLQPLYVEVHDNEWKFRVQLPVTIKNLNESPVAIPVETQKMDKGESYVGNLGDIFEDPDFDVLTYNVTGLPDGFIIENGYISGTPTKEGTYTVNVTATDPMGLSAENQFDIVVKDDTTGLEEISNVVSGGSFNGYLFFLFCLVGMIRIKKLII